MLKNLLRILINHHSINHRKIIGGGLGPSPPPAPRSPNNVIVAIFLVDAQSWPVTKKIYFVTLLKKKYQYLLVTKYDF